MGPTPSASAPGLLDEGITLVAVHAHPDDETLATGLALAHHVLTGSSVHVITATLGEEGEVIPAELRHLEGSEDLAVHRRGELEAAMDTLGVRHTFLGAENGRPTPRWRDSGMAGSRAARHSRAFVGAALDEAAAALLDQLGQIRPDVVLTYDPQGGYQHPDHIKTHQVVVAALTTMDPAQRPRMYVARTPASWAQQDRAWLGQHVPQDSGLELLGDDAAYPPSVGPDDVVTDRLVDAAAAELRTRALRHHRTQVSVFEGYFALSNGIAARLGDREGYQEWTCDG